QVITDPIQTIADLYNIFQNENERNIFLGAIGQTLFTVIVSFTISFILALVVAIFSNRFYNLRNILNPTVSVLRSSPTIAIIIILLLVAPWDTISYIVSFMVIFPLVFENMLTALDHVFNGELEAAKSLGLNFLQRVNSVYLPNISPALWASVISGFGLNYKVVIASEVFGFPKNTIGHNIVAAKQSFDYPQAFLWLVVSIVLALVIEFILSKTRNIFSATIYSKRYNI
ncbi:MAG: ABC transporter permease subunit, partial [Candidatus Ancillula sp.]|nr:ABC transporter permease subunit [Candidatus Ancillula sp.]